MLTRFLERYTHWIHRHPWLTILASLLVIVLLSAGAQRLIFKSDYRVFFSPENPQLQAFETMQRVYSKADNLLVCLRYKAMMKNYILMTGIASYWNLLLSI